VVNSISGFVRAIQQKESPGFVKPGLGIFLLSSSALAHFLDTCRLALQITQVVKLGAANLANHHDFDLVNTWSVQGENSFDTHAVGYFAHSERRTDIIIMTFDAAL